MSLKESGDRTRAFEAGYAARQERARLDRKRQELQRGEERKRLAAATGVTEPDVLVRLQDLGLTDETVVLLDLVPAVEVAWAEHVVTGREREVLWDLAEDADIEPGSPAHGLLNYWLDENPGAFFFSEARDLLAAALDAAPADEAARRRAAILDACAEVASASGGLLSAFGVGDGTNAEERAALRRIAADLGARAGSAGARRRA